MTSCAARAACLVGRRRLLATALGLTSRACTRAIQAAVLPDAMQLSVPRSDVDLVVSDVRMHYEYCRAATQHRATRTWLHATCNAILQRNVHRANRRRAADSSMPFLPIASGSTNASTFACSTHRVGRIRCGADRKTAGPVPISVSTGEYT